MNLQDQIEEKLRLNSSTGKAKFDSKLVKTQYPIQGVKMAFLEAYAKTLASQEKKQLLWTVLKKSSTKKNQTMLLWKH